MTFVQAIVATMALLVPAWLPAQEQAEDGQRRIEAEMCALTECQRNLRVVLKDKDGATFDRTFEVFPAIVQPFGIMVVAGQTVYIEADEIDGRLANLVAVESPSNPARTIVATFEQRDDGGMLLTVSNPFRKMLKFNMGIMPLDADDLYKTSSCPVIPGGKIFEMWPYPIFQVALGNGRFLEADEPMACVD